MNNNLKLIRKNHLSSVDELSKKINMPVLKIDKYESNTIPVPIAELIKYSQYFNTSLD